VGLFKKILGDLIKSNVGDKGSLPGRPPPRTYPKPMPAGEWDELADVQATQDEAKAAGILANLDAAEKLLYSGEWIYTPASSNVASFKWIKDNEELQVTYKDGSVYGYFDMTWPEAVTFLHADSKGKQVWDQLRRRGTVWGFQKRYVYYSGPSGNNRRWYQGGEESRRKHGQIPKSGNVWAKGGMGRKRGRKR